MRGHALLDQVQVPEPYHRPRASVSSSAAFHATIAGIYLRLSFVHVEHTVMDGSLQCTGHTLKHSA